MKMRFFASVTVLVMAAVSVACGRQAEEPAAAEVTLNVTSWTDKTELYMEYPPLIANQPARFAVHLTTLVDFRALNTGRPSVEFTPEKGGAPTVFAGTPPLRPGAFRVEGTLPAPGRYRWVLKVEAPGLSERHDLELVTIHADAKSAEAMQAPAEDATAFAYLKEQQWTTEFATEQVRQTELRTVVRVPASIEPLTGGEAVVSAPIAGRFVSDALLPVGSVVRPGQVVGQLQPRLSDLGDRATLIADLAQAQIAVDAARAEQARVERLLAERAVPGRRLEDARRAVTAADAYLVAAQARLAQRDETLRTGGGAAGGNTFVLRAPIGGRLTEVDATLGASYEEGAPLFRIVRTDRVQIRAHIPSSNVTVLRGVEQLELEIPGQELPILLQPRNIHDAGVLNPQTRALAVLFDVENPQGRLLVGQSGTVVIYQNNRVPLPAVPQAAVLQEAGRPFVFVQVSGERFARRPIEIAARDGTLIGVRSGVKVGDRVVTKGAYEVQLASAARGLPSEGHVH